MESSEEGEVSAGQSPELDAKDERNVSWRVPNSPKQHEVNEESAAVKVDSPKERIFPTTERSVTPRSESNPSSPYEGRKASRVAKTTSENSSDEPKNNSTSKLWRHLFAGVTRSVDELYVYCEELEDTAKCQEVIDLLKRSRLDFKKLSERIDEQSNVPQGQALSWDIRKPTLPSPSNPNGAILGYSNPNSHRASPVLSEEITTGGGSDLHQSRVPTENASLRSEAEELAEKKKKLNPEAKPFSPAILSSIFPTPPATAMIAVIDPAVAPMLPPAVVDLGSAGKTSMPTRSARVKSTPKGPPIASVHRSGPPGLEHHRADSSSRSLFEQSSASKDEEELEDARLQAEVLQASEQVWAAAEAWVEAEAAAEEQEWQMLASGIKSYLHQHQHSSGGLSDYDYDDEPTQYNHHNNHSLSLLGLGLPSTSASAHNSPKQFPGMGPSLGGAAAEGAEWGGNAFLLSPEQRAIWEEQPAPRSGIYRAGNNPGSAFHSRSRTGSRSNLLAPVHTPKASAGAKKSHPTSRMTIETSTSHSPSKASPGFAHYHSPTGADNHSSYRSPSQSPTDFYLRSGGTPASGGRSLHDKLSSPDRKKARSPTELQRKIEERHNNAEMLRDKTVAERVQKASIASQRVKQAEEREAQRISEKKQIIEDKQLAAQERLQANLRQIQERANQEISKVNEVLFNKDLNKEAMAQKLEEAETRVMAASARRQERLQNLTLDQKRRNARKAQQLSEWRLRFEKENMDRWDKLQQRLDQVSARRAARLIELQRRADEKLQGNEAAAAAAVALATEAGSVAADAVAPPTGKVFAASGMFHDITPTKAYLSHTSAEGERLISQLRKGVVSAQVAAKANPTGAITSPRTPLTSKRGGVQAAKKAPSPVPPSMSVAVDDAEAPTQLRSKAKEKREKRKLKAQLIEEAEKADYAAIQEAMALNSGANSSEHAAEVTTTATVPAADRTAAAALPVEPTEAEKFLQALHTFQRCPTECAEEGFTVARAAQKKKIHLAAKTELNRLCALDLTDTTASGPTEVAPAAGCLSREYTESDTEARFVAALQGGAGVDGPNLLALVVKDLLSAASASASTSLQTLSASPASSLNMHVMQRLFVLLETAPSVSTASPTKVSNTATAATGANPTSGETEPVLCEVMLLRMLFGPEVGVLSCPAEYLTLLEAVALQHCNHNPLWRGTKEALASAVVTQELEVKAEVWTLVFTLLASCAETPAGAGLILQSGLGAILVDFLHVLLKSLESAQSSEGVYPTAVTFAAANVLSVLSKLFCLTPGGASEGATTIRGQCSQATVDAFVWYVFASAQVSSLVDLLRGVTLRWEHSQSYHYLSTTSVEQRDQTPHVLAVCADFVVAAAGFLSSVHAFIGRSGGLMEQSSPPETVVIESVLQLSPPTHRHSKGRQLVSLVRRAEVLPAVLGLLRALLDCDVYRLPVAVIASTTESAQASKTVLVDSLLSLSRLMEVAHSLVRADRSLGQGLSAEQQGQWVESIGAVLGHLQYALDGPPQALFPAQYTGRGALPFLQLQKGDLEHTLRYALTTLALTCLQNGALQKLCGAAAPSNASAGRSVGNKSLMAQICSWTPKYFKDKRFKHAMLPCLISLCLDCDGNVLQLQRLGKLNTVLKYLEYSVKTREVYLQQQQRRKSDPSSALTEEAQHLQRLSHLLPTDLWSIALVTLSQHEPQP